MCAKREGEGREGGQGEGEKNGGKGREMCFNNCCDMDGTSTKYKPQ